MAYPSAIKEHAFNHYERLGSLRAAHRALSDELRQKGSKAPTFRVFGTWAKEGRWAQRRAAVEKRVAELVDERTSDRLAAWRAKTAAKLDPVVESALADPDLFAATAKPGEIVQVIKLLDQLRGGGDNSPGSEGKPLVVKLWKADEAAEAEGGDGESEA
jgi:hypothetical protein